MSHPQTHISVNTQATIVKGLTLSQSNTESSVIEVRETPITLNVWGLVGSDTVAVHRVRVGQLGNIGFEDGGCCDPIVPPSPAVNIDRKPYAPCGVPLVITASNSEYTLDDSGTFVCVYIGTTQCTIEPISNKITVKNSPCGC